MQNLVASLQPILGPKGWESHDILEGQWRDWLNRFGERPLGIARPATTQEVSTVVAACHTAGVPITPQGGNTSLCGAAVLGRPGGVILSMSRMNSSAKPNSASASIEVQSGLVLAELHEMLRGSGQMFPMHLGAEGSAQIGGLIGCNAGGSHAFRYGMMQDLVLGLEVVLPDGSVWDGLRSVQKDNAGYQLRKLFCGAEGTLGIVTRAVLKLFPEPKQRATALLALASAEDAVEVGVRLRAEAGEFLTGIEFFSGFGLELALKHVNGIVYPLDTRSPFYLLVEVASGSERVPLAEILEVVLTEGLEQQLIVDGAIAASDAQRLVFWQLREEQPEGQRLEGPQLKHDISIPPERIADFLKAGEAICTRLLPGVRFNPFGHLADGNIHYNLSPSSGSSDFAGRDGDLGVALASLARDMGGSFAAEHGLGRSKINLADQLRGASERALMRSIKSAIDPKFILNPGVIMR